MKATVDDPYTKECGRAPRKPDLWALKRAFRIPFVCDEMLSAFSCFFFLPRSFRSTKAVLGSCAEQNQARGRMGPAGSGLRPCSERRVLAVAGRSPRERQGEPSVSCRRHSLLAVPGPPGPGDVLHLGEERAERLHQLLLLRGHDLKGQAESGHTLTCPHAAQTEAGASGADTVSPEPLCQSPDSWRLRMGPDSERGGRRGHRSKWYWNRVALIPEKGWSLFYMGEVWAPGPHRQRRLLQGEGGRPQASRDAGNSLSLTA